MISFICNLFKREIKSTELSVKFFFYLTTEHVPEELFSIRMSLTEMLGEQEEKKKSACVRAYVCVECLKKKNFLTTEHVLEELFSIRISQK